MNKPLILLTRPQAQSHHFAQTLHARGYDTLIDPLLTINPIPATLDTHGIGGTLITSIHALDAVKHARELHALPCFAVGAITAEAARAAGFTHVTSAATASDLATVLPHHIPLLYARGRHTAFTFPSTILLREIIVYEAHAATQFSPDTRDALHAQRIAAIPFFSARSGAILASLVTQENLTPHLRSIHAAAISKAAYDAINHLPWKRVLTSDAPDALHLADTMDKMLRED